MKKGQPQFVQIDLSIHGELWEDFYDLLIAEQRKDEESIPFVDAINRLKELNNEQQTTEPILTRLPA